MTQPIEAPLASANAARLAAALGKQYRSAEGKVMSLQSLLDLRKTAPTHVCSQSDGTIDWSRTKFNRMDNKEQAAYEARLKAKRYYWVNDIQVPKIVFDWAKAA